MLPILISTAAAAAIAAGFWDFGGRSLKDQQFWPGCCANVDQLTSATPTVLIILYYVPFQVVQRNIRERVDT